MKFDDGGLQFVPTRKLERTDQAVNAEEYGG